MLVPEERRQLQTQTRVVADLGECIDYAIHAGASFKPGAEATITGMTAFNTGMFCTEISLSTMFSGVYGFTAENTSPPRV